VKARTAQVIGLALWVSACGAAGPRGRSTLTSSPVAQAQATHEYPSPASPPQHAAGGASSAISALAAFATAYINWSAGTVAADMRALASHSIGQARAAMQLAATQTASDYELQRGGIANSGIVEAVALVRGRSDQYVVVTRELTTAAATTAYQGLQPAWHVAVATVIRQGAGQWVVSRWQPEN
jgi:hypothetical protein